MGMARGRLSQSVKGTIISASVAVGLLAVAGVIMLLLPDPRPADLDAARAPLIEVFDRIQATISADQTI